jgi:hypothetical protein
LCPALLPGRFAPVDGTGGRAEGDLERGAPFPGRPPPGLFPGPASPLAARLTDIE